MKKITLSILTIAVTASAGWAQLDRSIKPKPGPAPEIKLGTTQSFTLPNGLRVFVVENHKLPTVACNMELDIKPELEGDMAGYMDMMGELLLSGTKTRTKERLNSEIDQMGATINADENSIEGSALKKYQGKLLELMADIAMNTVIKQDELDKEKKRAISGMESEKNDPDAMVRNVSAVVNYGKNHPYGEVANEGTVNKISLDRVNHYYSTYFRPNVCYMAIVGDVTMAEVKPLVEQYFGKWEKKEVPVTAYSIPAIASTKLTKVAFAPRTAAVQSVVSVTYPVDMRPNNPDLIKTRVATTVLGGGSQGRLFLNLREKHAWTYGAYANMREDNLGGSFSATVKCRNVVSDSAVGAILDEMRAMQTAPVDDATLQNCITYLSGNFAIGLEDPKRVAQYAINTERYNLPKDFYRNYLKNLSAVTAADVTDVSKKYIRPDNANIVVAGSKEEVADKLARFSADGKIDFYGYDGKPMEVAATKALPAGVTAETVYQKYITAMGGEKAWSSIKDIKIVSTSEMQGMPLTITEMKKAPTMWKQYVDISMGGKTMTVQKQAFNGTTGYQEQQGQKAPLAGDDLEEVKEQADWTMELHPEKYGVKRTLKGMEQVNGKYAYVVEVMNAKGKKSMEYYDENTAMLVKKVQGEGEKVQSSEYSDYREVPGTNGYKVPYMVTESQQGMSFKATVKSVDVNKGIADAEFN